MGVITKLKGVYVNIRGIWSSKWWKIMTSIIMMLDGLKWFQLILCVANATSIRKQRRLFFCYRSGVDGELWAA